MDLVLVSLHVLFFVPIAARRLSRGSVPAAPRRGILAEVVAGLRSPATLIHGVALVLMWLGVALAITGGVVTRAPTLRGLLGAAVVAGSVAFLAWAVAALRSWRLLPEIDREHELCTSGPYRLVRHPIYAALDLLALGTALWVPSVPLLAAGALMLLGGDLRARSEERALRAAFGDRYAEYSRRVRRLVPGLY